MAVATLHRRGDFHDPPYAKAPAFTANAEQKLRTSLGEHKALQSTSKSKPGNALPKHCDPAGMPPPASPMQARPNPTILRSTHARILWLRWDDVQIFVEPELLGINVISHSNLHHVHLHRPFDLGSLNVNIALLLRQSC